MAKEKSKIDMKRININAPATLVDRVKEYADNLGINTTSAYIVLLNQALDQKDTLDILPVILDLVNQAKEMANNEQSQDNDFESTDANEE